MKKIILSGIVVYSLLLLGGCQLIQEFVFINASENEIEIEYVIKESGLLPQENLFLPQTMTLANWNKWFGEKKWQAKPPEQYDFVDNERKFRVKLISDEVLLIEREDSYYINNDGEKG